MNVRDLRTEKLYENSFVNSLVFNLNEIQNISIKEGLLLQSTYISCIKNLLNHILESFITLISSLSSHILHLIYHEIVLKCAFLPSVRFFKASLLNLVDIVDVSESE